MYSLAELQTASPYVSLISSRACQSATSSSSASGSVESEFHQLFSFSYSYAILRLAVSDSGLLYGSAGHPIESGVGHTAPPVAASGSFSTSLVVAVAKASCAYEYAYGDCFRLLAPPLTSGDPGDSAVNDAAFAKVTGVTPDARCFSSRSFGLSPASILTLPGPSSVPLKRAFSLIRLTSLPWARALLHRFVSARCSALMSS